MADFVILSDSSSDFTAELRQRFDVPDIARGVVYFPDGHEELSDLDWERYTPQWYYDSMKDRKTLYKTASPPEGELRRIFEKHLSQGKDILYVSISSAISGGYQSSLLVAKELLALYPERKICCVDSLRYSMAESLLLVLASRKRQEGASLEETAAYLEEKKHCVHQMGPMDDLFFLTKTGRISNFKAFFGTLTGVNPMADFNRNGLAEVLAKFKGKRTALEATVRYIEQTAENISEQLVFIAHSNRQSVAELLAQTIQERLQPKEIIIHPVGMSCGATIGPGLCGAYYLGKPVSQDTAEEKAIITRIAEELK